MDSLEVASSLLLCLIIGAFTVCDSYDDIQWAKQNLTASLFVDGSATGSPIPDTLFGIFFEEINHAGSGGIWAELVDNRGFEAGGRHIPSNIHPWSIIGDDSSIIVSTDLSSCFELNKVALRMDVLCDSDGANICPSGGVGVYNPGFWGMNIERGMTYKVVFYVRSSTSIDLCVSFTSSSGLEVLATTNIIADASEVGNWTKKEVTLKAKSSDSNARLQLTTTKKGVVWFDQVSAMPTDTYRGHGFRKDLVQMLIDLKPRFFRFPGGCYVEGEWLRNAYRWKETVGPWEERPGHFGDVWKYWTDDGLGYFEYLQLAEDLGAAPVWVVNNGISHEDEVATEDIWPFVQEMLDSVEFARGDPSSKWGSIRAAMGHPEPFDLKYIAVGNEDCGKKYYRGNYLQYYYALKKAYPDIKVITNCDGSSAPLNHPADFYDFHIYTTASSMFSQYHKFDKTQRYGPKAFVSEYAVNDNADAGKGSLLAALAEAAFLIGIEKNSDIVEMASYAPLFVNANDRRWNPDAIVFNSSHVYGTPSYWMQQFFAKSSGAILLPTLLVKDYSASLVASAIRWEDTNNKCYTTIKIVNFGDCYVNLKIFNKLNRDTLRLSGVKKTVLTSNNVMHENSFENPTKVTPDSTELDFKGLDDEIWLQPYSLTSLDLLQEQDNDLLLLKESDSLQKSSF